MTVTYSAEVATSRGFGCFWKLLFRWRGSIYKLLWPDLSLYFLLYYFLSLLYRFVLDDPQRRYFEKISVYCKTYGDLIPVSFILGFYVSIVVKRWWDCFSCIPWPDTLAFFVSAYIHGQDDRGRLMRRSIMRYANLAFVVTLTCISPCVKKRFPTMDHLVDAGILLPNERKVMEQMQTTHSTYWMPLVWASSIAIRARKEGRIRDDFALNTLVEAIANYRSLCGGLYNYDWVSIPLVYTQVVTLVVYTFFLATLMGRQYLDPEQGHPGYDVDLYIPIFNFLQFFFYMGWLKVAETLVNPFGEDDDDFEVNWVIDRDIQVSYLIVDEMHQEHPELIKDQYWDDIMPDLPYTAAAMPFYTEPPMGSAANLVIPPHEAEFVPLDTVEEDEELADVKVNGMPCEGTNNNTKLTQNLSGSSYSGISKLGRSFNPASYEGKGILNMMQDLFSRESSVRKKKLWKAPSKDSTIGPPASCDTSGPPTPDEYKSGGGFSDDIFHLSDLSLADSRGTSSTQSPGYYNVMHAEDFFWGKKRDRKNRKVERSISKVSTPQSEVAEDEGLRTPSVLMHKSTNSFRHFFRSTKFRGSQKSLLSTGNRVAYGSKPKLSFKFGNQDVNDENSGSISKQPDEKQSPDLSDEEVTVIEAVKEKQNMSKSTNYIDKTRCSKVNTRVPFNKARNSLPHDLDLSPEKPLRKLTKDPSTATLIPGEGSLEDTSPLNENIFSDAILPSTSDTIQGVESTTNQTISRPTAATKKKLFLKLYPKRAVSLRVNEYRKSSDTSSLSGLQKFFGSRKNFETVSQPVSPTGVESSFFKQKVPSCKNIFNRKLKNEGSGSRRPSMSIDGESAVKGDISSQNLIEEQKVKNICSKSSDV